MLKSESTKIGSARSGLYGGDPSRLSSLSLSLLFLCFAGLILSFLFAFFILFSLCPIIRRDGLSVILCTKKRVIIAVWENGYGSWMDGWGPRVEFCFPKVTQILILHQDRSIYSGMNIKGPVHSRILIGRSIYKLKI